MKRLALVLCLALSVPAFADVDAGVLDAGAADAGVAAAAPAPSPVVATADAPKADDATPPSLDSPLPFLKIVFLNVKNGNWWGAAAALLVLLVSLLRLYGKKLHEWLPDNLIWDKPLWFLFDTKPGGWLVNLLTAVAGGIGTAQLAGEPVTWALVKPILTVAVTGAALWEMLKDLFEWAKAKGAAKAEAIPAPPPTKP